ncbi:transferase [Kickxella alabastrina]|uniref:transferase n=1 Tax=Kickxella alabastrina TaxID=61397 RepID=UPI0022205657|nr:transferase [Kickxella alabastrina]KAI7826380.1 transferase [Kickxella alabastrina]
MEEFVNSIESQVIPITVIDTQGSFSNIPFVFFYENTEASDSFMLSDSLRNSFFRTMQQIPMFAGHIRTEGRGRVSVVVDKDNINMPDYRESNSDVHFDDLKSAKFRWSAWPDGVNTAGPMTAADENGEIKLINVHVIRLQANSGVMVYVSMVHYVVDGPAHMQIIKRWCEIHQLMKSDQAEKIADMQPFITDRSSIQHYLPKERAQLHKETAKTFEGFSIVAEWMAWISPKLRGYIISKVIERQNAKAHLFHVSRAAFESLRDSISGYIPDIDKISDNELMLSLTSKTRAQAQSVVESRIKGAVQPAVDTPSKGTVPVAVIFEVRDHLGLSDKLYAGNILIPKIMCCPVAELESATTVESLSRTLTDFRQVTKDITLPYIASHMDMVASRPSSFAKPLARFMNHKSAMTFVYDVMPDMYQGDFGYGRPAWVSPIKEFRANGVLLLTSQDSSDGIDVFMTALPDVMKEILKNEFWTNVAKRIY